MSSKEKMLLWLSRYTNLVTACQAVRGKPIAARTWCKWEKLAGVCKNDRLDRRIYTRSQVNALLCIAYLRKHEPRTQLTYRIVREYADLNEDKISQCVQMYCDGELPVEQPREKTFYCTDVKQKCDLVRGHKIYGCCWARWKQHVGIAKHEKQCSQAQAYLLVFISVWRIDNPTQSLPSLTILENLASQYYRKQFRIEASCANKQKLQWHAFGCEGRHLQQYLQSCGYAVGERFLYNRGYSRRKYYSPQELLEWRRIVAQAKYQCA